MCAYVFIHSYQLEIFVRIFTYKLATYAYQPATSPVCKMPYFVGHVGLVACALGFMGRI